MLSVVEESVWRMVEECVEERKWRLEEESVWTLVEERVWRLVEGRLWSRMGEEEACDTRVNCPCRLVKESECGGKWRREWSGGGEIVYCSVGECVSVWRPGRRSLHNSWRLLQV